MTDEVLGDYPICMCGDADCPGYEDYSKCKHQSRPKEKTMPELTDEDLKERVDQFRTMSLPGQSMGMHMGTAYLVADLWTTIESKNAMLEAKEKTIAGMEEDIEEMDQRINQLEDMRTQLLRDNASTVTYWRNRSDKLLERIKELENDQKQWRELLEAAKQEAEIS